MAWLGTIPGRAADLAGTSSPAPALFEPWTGPALGGEGPGGGPDGGGLGVRWSGRRDPGSWREGDRWSVPVPGGGRRTFRVGTVRWVDDTRVSVTGDLEGDPGSSVLLTSNGGAFALTLRGRDGQRFLVQPGPGGRHRVTERSTDEAGGDCGNDGGGDDEPAGGRAAVAAVAAVAALAAGPAAAGTGTVEVIDIAFFHTPAAEAGAGGPAGMRALVDLAVLESNDAYARSGALVQLRAVSHRRVDYVESGDLTTDLGRISRTGDGIMDDVHAVRDEVAADLVCLIVESEAGNRLAGMANQLLGTTPDLLARGFTVCVRPFLIGNYTVPHEVGHLLGCTHDRETTASGGLHFWSHGTRITVEGTVYRTVMAYRPGLQFPHFSNPRLTFRGVPTGIAEGRDAADNVRTLNTTAPLIAGVRTPASRVGFAEAQRTVGEDMGTLRVRLLRSGRLDAATVQVRAVPGSAVEGVDYFPPVLERIELPAGVAEVPVELGLVDNSRADGPRLFALNLSGPSTGVALGPVVSMTVVVADDETESAAVIDTRFRPLPGTDHGVAALADSGDGGILVGGSFATANGIAHPRLARFRPDGSVDASFVPNVKYAVHAVVRWPDGRLAIGGDFNTVRDVRLNHVAVLQADGTLDPGFEFDAGTDLPVRALGAMADGRLVIAGGFTDVQGRAIRRVARLLASGQPDLTFASVASDTGGAPDDEVLALAPDGVGGWYIGGRFRRSGGRLRPGLDRWAADGVPDATFAAAGDADGAVHALAMTPGGGVIAGGGFRRFLGHTAGGVVRLTAGGAVDGDFLSATGSGADDAVLAVAVAPDGRIWVGGRFGRFDGRERRRLARLRSDGSLDEAFDAGIGPDDVVQALHPRDGGGVWLGGMFTRVNGVARGGVAALLDGSPAPARFGRVTAGDGGLTWEAAGEAWQGYDVERSTDLSGWTVESTVNAAEAAAGGRMQGVFPMVDGAGGFLRLRRRLE